MKILQKTIPLTAPLGPSQIKGHPQAARIRTLEVVETRTGFDAILETVDKKAENVVVVIRGVAGYVERSLVAKA